MKLFVALLVLASALAFVPTASACSPLINCVPGETQVCLDAIPIKCFVVDPRGEVVHIIRELIGPCTCPPL